MPRLRALARIAGAGAVMTAVCAAGVGAHPAVAPATVTVADTAVPFTSLTAAAGDLASAKALTIEVWLRPDLTVAQRFATEVSTPGNPMFRDFLTPDAYTARFGPTTHEVSAMRSWLRSRGFSTVAADTQRDYVRATATVAEIDAAFHTTMKEYPRSAQASGERSPLYTNDRSLTVPASLAPDILGVTKTERRCADRPAGTAGFAGELPG
jgi:hypothetical protein